MNFVIVETVVTFGKDRHYLCMVDASALKFFERMWAFVDAEWIFYLLTLFFFDSRLNSFPLHKLSYRIMKKIFFALVVLAVVTAGGYFFQKHYQRSQLSEIELANIEALALGEFTPNGWTCFDHYYDDLSSDLFVTIIRCGDCYTTTATFASDSDYCWHK